MPSSDQAYKGYLIRQSRAGTWIEKGGVLIGWAADEDDAKHIIRELTRGGNPPFYVKFATDKNGRRRAWRWSYGAHRWFPLSIVEAEQALATGAARVEVQGSRMKFLVNPPSRRTTMARKAARDSRGRFKPGGTHRRRRKNPANPPRAKRRRRTVRKTAAKRRTTRRRRNPPRTTDLVGMLVDGALGAVEVIGGKVAVRALPGVVGLPTAGNTGLAIQAALAVALGWVTDMFAGPDVARMVLAGGLAAPMESVIAGANLPVISAAVGGTMGSYVRARLPNYPRAPVSRRLPPTTGKAGVVLFRGWQTSPPGSGIEYFE